MITYTMTWSNGNHSSQGGGGSFVLTDEKGAEHQFHYVAHQIRDIQNPVLRAVADEIHNQSGAPTGTVTVSIA